MVYNTTKLVNGSGIVEITQGINDASNGFFSVALLLVMFIILMIAFKNYETRVALLTASTITTFVATIMAIMNFVQYNVVIVGGFIVFLTLIWLALGE